MAANISLCNVQVFVSVFVAMGLKTIDTVASQVAGIAIAKPATTSSTATLDNLREKLEKKLEKEQESHTGTKRKLEEALRDPISQFIAILNVGKMLWCWDTSLNQARRS